ncbi:MAG: glucose/arabinose dehydrogenase [Chlamydiales bacterium]|jgi:glucose/arabinose dehydrogenase
MIRSAFVLFALTSVPAYSQSIDDARIGVELWSSALSRPAAFTFIGPGEMLVVENATGEVVYIKDGLVQSIALDVITSAEGALGITCHPDFASNGFVYYYHTTASTDGGGWRGSQVMRYRFDGEFMTEPFGPVFTSPYDLDQDNTNNHNGGTLRFGPDGMLYGQVGDKHRGSSTNGRIELNSGTAESSRSGGIFRIHPGGEIPHDNPFIDHPNLNVRAWYCYGFRNSLGMDFDPVSGELWWSDNGPDVYDEINRGGSGMNGGWGLIAGPDARDAVFLKNGYVARDEADLVQLPGSFYRDPEYSVLPTPGVTGVCFLNSKRFPADLRNNLIYGEVNGQIYNFQLDQAREHLILTAGLADGVADDLAERDQARFGSGLGLVTEIQMGPDGYLYLADYGGGFIRRIRPLVDVFEPLTAQAVRGNIESGAVADLEFADDATLAMRSAPDGRS